MIAVIGTSGLAECAPSPLAGEGAEPLLSGEAGEGAISALAFAVSPSSGSDCALLVFATLSREGRGKRAGSAVRHITNS